MMLTAPLVAFAALSVKTAADFSKAMAKVNAVTGATTEQFEALNAVAKELGKTTQFTASQVAEAMSFMGMAGMTTDEILASIPDTLNLAAAGALDMGSAANIVTNILAGFGMETSELGGAVDVLAKAFTSSNTDLQMLGESMKFAGPVAKGFGMSFEETAAIMGIFGNAGIQASLAGTSLRGAIVQLNNKAEDFGLTMYDSAGKMLPMADILEQLEKKGMTAGEMMELFGLRAGPAMTALLETGSDALRDFTGELENAGGTAKQIAEVQMQGIHGSITRLKSAFEGLQLTIAEYIVPVLETLIEKLKGAFEWFQNLSGDQKGILIKTIAAVAMLGPALIILSQVIKAITVLQWLWNIALTANPIGLIIVGVVALGAAMAALGILIHNHWDGIIQYFANVGESIKGIFLRIAEYMYQPIRTAVDWIITVINSMIRGFNSVFGMLGLHINEIAWRMPDVFGQQKSIREAAEKEKEVEERRERGDLTDEEIAADIRAIRKGQTPPSEMPDFREKEQGPIVIPHGVREYASGGPILGPTVLSSLRTGMPYAVAGERGPESVVPGGGYQTANIVLEIDGVAFARVAGVPIVDEIRLKTGVRL